MRVLWSYMSGTGLVSLWQQHYPFSPVPMRRTSLCWKQPPLPVLCHVNRVKEVRRQIGTVILLATLY